MEAVRNINTGRERARTSQEAKDEGLHNVNFFIWGMKSFHVWEFKVNIYQDWLTRVKSSHGNIEDP